MDGWLSEPDFQPERTEWDVDREAVVFASIVNNALQNGGAPTND